MTSWIGKAFCQFIICLAFESTDKTVCVIQENKFIWKNFFYTIAFF